MHMRKQKLLLVTHVIYCEIIMKQNILLLINCENVTFYVKKKKFDGI